MIRDDATEAQVRAANPQNSTWLAANAGSGKTRVLTDRVARLLVQGADPQRILCLTYTKAAASEMQNRLFKRLGEWAMLSEDALETQLRDMGQEGLTEDDLRRARTLFAKAIETPGGLKIQTIHSFCAAILRRFPLEARVSPGFSEMEDRAATLMRAQIVEEMAEDAVDATSVRAVAAYLSDQDYDKLTNNIVTNRAGFLPSTSRNDLLSLFGLPAGFDAGDLLDRVFLGDERDILTQMIPVMQGGKPTDKKAADTLATIHDFDIDALQTLESVFLGKSGKFENAAKIGDFPTKDTRDALGPLMPRIEAFMLRVESARDTRLAWLAAQRSAVLHDFAARFLARYEARKTALGWLDFDDLILKARDLLSDRAVAAWVLFRLDGGIDHILVDEAQDTSPPQWQVIELLAQEIISGQGARADVARTIFVVGDKKQSIYSFQGADPREFDRMQAEFRDRLAPTDSPLVSSVLEYSFRSAEAILRLVDLVFEGRHASGFPQDNKHRAFKHAMPGRVDLWPVIPKTEDEEKGDWHDPVDLVSDEHHYKILAQRVAEFIAEQIRRKVGIPKEVGNTGIYEMRPVQAGDFLILVQRRSEIFSEIIRACKELGLPMAGADRLKVGGELAVRDLGAVMAFLAVPEDDLSLAAALKSPLFGWTEQQLFDLAHRRPEKSYLWASLRDRAAEFPETMAILDDLRKQADFLRPFDLIERILTRHDGRRRLLARLGVEAEDGIDAFLAQALAYETSAVPSLHGFLQWMESDELQIKRQMDSAGNCVRVMTVHGAKGLEAPIVILPETGARRASPGQTPFILHEGRAIWAMSKNNMPAVLAQTRAAQAAAEQAERDRLLYVAMTRAEKWLIVAAAGDTGKDGESWYDKVQVGMQRAGGQPHEFALGQGLRLETGDWSLDVVEPEHTNTPTPDLPALFRTRASPPVAEPKAVAPSDLGGAKALPGDDGLDEEAAKARGRHIHLLLEHLAGKPVDQRPDLTARILSGPDRADPSDWPNLLAEAAGVLDAPDLAHIFDDAALAEVPFTADLGNGRRLNGLIDRLILTDTSVLAIDFKTNATVPETPDQVPDGLLRQMASYAHALRQIYPERDVCCALLWTRTARLMALPNDLLQAAFARIEVK